MKNDNDNKTAVENDTLTSEKKYFLSDASYALLREAQAKIREATEMIPSFRKIINELVNPEAVEKLTQRYIDQLK